MQNLSIPGNNQKSCQTKKRKKRRTLNEMLNDMIKKTVSLVDKKNSLK